MLPSVLTVLSALVASSIAKPVTKCRQAAVTCPIVFDGRVPQTATVQDFDTAGGGGFNPFNPNFVKGNNLTWSEILLLPTITPASRFDAAKNTRPVEVTISDESIFMTQLGFRRAELQFANDTGSGSPGSVGVKTLHFSVQTDAQRRFNESHEYLNVWHETAVFDANQFNFQTGTIIGQPELPANTWKLLDRNNALLWSTPVLDGVWQNFGLTLDFNANTIGVLYSEGDKPLAPSGKGAFPANLAGEGQYHVGILKKPTGTDDVVNSGFQESPLNEGLIYAGVFIEDSANGCVSK
ncbi:conserved hypothetical protein [Verticillium alfalfae VaMs.102]|uniref:Glycoside hydrolase 131 catalytic N-terminal domain-containing protein n=1 Tax=Verticillium alfalfae (strain VaMs.102 / ATCC MYA-4576 / FGSC 10136) TaxID=526221 RepID=C9SJ07_VERA1|nr:conserved hypothetical protein [Verticillium alfalfae VaMs.102]EEY18930.1 conserved hypothetical protein [Verticillium alfalfae VaMs.102]